MPHTHTKMNTKWIIDLNVKPKAIKLQIENIAHSLILVLAISFCICLLRQGNRSKNKQMELHQTKKLCTVKETINRKGTKNTVLEGDWTLFRDN